MSNIESINDIPKGGREGSQGDLNWFSNRHCPRVIRVFPPWLDQAIFILEPRAVLFETRKLGAGMCLDL